MKRYERTGEWRMPLHSEWYETQHGPRLAGQRETDYEFWILREVPVAESSPVYSAPVTLKMESLDTYVSVPPLYRTVGEVVTAVVKDYAYPDATMLTKFLTKHLSRYRPESEAEKMLTAMRRAVSHLEASMATNNHTRQRSDVLEARIYLDDAIRAAMAAEKGEQK